MSTNEGLHESNTVMDRALSRVVISRFCFTVSLFAVWLSFQPHGLTDGKFAMAMAGAAAATGKLAAVFGEPFRGPT